MDRRLFSIYKQKYQSAIQQVLRKEHTLIHDEAAFPAYSNPNHLMNFLFWERLYQTIKMIEKGKPRLNILDFGCGSGVMLPYLSSKANVIYGCDIDLTPANQIDEIIPFNNNIQLITSYKKIQKNTIDLIISLDVLEHITNLEKTLKGLSDLLKPGGEIIISGPSENLLYKIGRFLAGSQYSGDYHTRNIYQIKKIFSKYFSIQKTIKLYGPAPFFLILSGHK